MMKLKFAELVMQWRFECLANLQRFSNLRTNKIFPKSISKVNRVHRFNHRWRDSGNRI